MPLYARERSRPVVGHARGQRGCVGRKARAEAERVAEREGKAAYVREEQIQMSFVSLCACNLAEPAI